LGRLEQSLNGSRAEAIDALKIAVQGLVVDDSQSGVFRPAA
jgi:hypothetical protein